MGTPARRHDVGDIRCLDGFLMPQAAAPSASPELHEPNLANAESESLPRPNIGKHLHVRRTAVSLPASDGPIRTAPKSIGLMKSPSCSTPDTRRRRKSLWSATT